MSIRHLLMRSSTWCWSLMFLAVVLVTVPGRAAEIIYSAGHADIGAAYDGGGLELHYHFGEGAVLDGVAIGEEQENRPDEVITIVPGPPASRPPGAQWNFLGNTAGEPLWILDQNDVEGTPFLGFAAEELEPGDWSTPITFSLEAVSGPGEFSLYQTDRFGNPKIFATTFKGFDGVVDVTDTWSVSIGGHSHYNFAFTAPGDYLLKIGARGTHVTDGLIISDVADFQFRVVPEPSALTLAVSACLLGIVPALRRRWSRRPPQ